jgi:ABC-2 type transport system permease protein
MEALAQAWPFTLRDLRALLRQPWYVAITLVQPVIWLLLFGALFKSVAEVPGFTDSSYVEFLAPGIVIMVALFSSGWNGMGTIQDLDRGVMDRFLVTPVHRSSFITGRIANSAFGIAVQSVIIIGLALLVGATFSNGVVGVLVLIGLAALLGMTFAAFSNGVALLARKEETLIGLVQFIVLPLSFMSATFMQQDLMPGWMQTVSKFNPVNWAVEAGRQAATGSLDWSYIGVRAGLLAALMVAAIAFATRAFHGYQRSV